MGTPEFCAGNDPDKPEMSADMNLRNSVTFLVPSVVVPALGPTMLLTLVDGDMDDEGAGFLQNVYRPAAQCPYRRLSPAR